MISKRFPAAFSARRWTSTNRSGQAFWNPFINGRWKWHSRIGPSHTSGKRRSGSHSRESRSGSIGSIWSHDTQIVVELKAVKAFEDIHYAQLKSYLKATGLKVGLLLNFNAPTVAIKRVVL